MNPEKVGTYEGESLQTKKIARAAIEETAKESIEKAPEDYFSLNGLAREIGRDKATIKKRIGQLGIGGDVFRDKTGSNITVFYSPEEKNIIQESFSDLARLGQAPEEYAPLGGLSDSMGIDIDEKTIKKRIEELGLEGEKHVSKTGRVYTYYSPEEQNIIKESFEEQQSMGQVPAGYYTINGICQSIEGVSFKTIKKAINTLLLVGKTFRDKQGRVQVFYSEEQRQRIIDSLREFATAEEATEDELSLRALSQKLNVDKDTIKRRIEILQSGGESFGKVKKKHNNITVFYSPEEQSIIQNALEHCLTQASIPESSVAFYFAKAGQDVKQNMRPEWLKNPSTNANLEVDIFCPSLGVGIEYDGFFYHQDVEHDVKKDQLARENGYKIIHIREKGCPEMPDDSLCVNRRDNSDDNDLNECINKCFEMLDIPVPDIDVARDKKDIMAFMRQRALDKLDAATALEELSVVS